MRDWSERHRLAGRRVGFVPTMGALHEGHLALVDEARRHSDVVVVSVFVNPLQFDVRADFDRYPRPIDDDLRACADAGVDAVYAPTAAAMYPPGFQTHVEPGPLAERLEGEHRPGHFRGVTTVVAKLFAAVRPHVAVFGQKDAQQLAVVRRMALDLDLGIEIVGMPTVREPDGLALSSRNRRLGPEQRAAAVVVSRALRSIEESLRQGTTDATVLVRRAAEVIDAEPLARLEHVEIVDPDTFEPVHTVDRPSLALAAVWFGEVRLIDNLLLSTG
ncbi:MAG: pantoate--beta-alanine ligase [Actinobacteria bacterium]|uniref:pantoate--beta-alanine ligase (AMP-forming) n=1 Tax=freshwater metagenome TaxID=449393 RepID=A0A6J6C676_9ZZZZ|nr:pantoate--beta-alanine ligase [Actinomycetota bacterium]